MQRSEMILLIFSQRLSLQFGQDWLSFVFLPNWESEKETESTKQIFGILIYRNVAGFVFQFGPKFPSWLTTPWSLHRHCRDPSQSSPEPCDRKETAEVVTSGGVYPQGPQSSVLAAPTSPPGMNSVPYPYPCAGGGGHRPGVYPDASSCQTSGPRLPASGHWDLGWGCSCWAAWIPDFRQTTAAPSLWNSSTSSAGSETRSSPVGKKHNKWSHY